MGKDLVVEDELNSKKSLDMLMKLVDECPNPTQSEIRRLLAVQAAMLHHLSVGMIQQGKSGSVKLGFQAMKMSQDALIAASRISETEGEGDSKD